MSNFSLSSEIKITVFSSNEGTSNNNFSRYKDFDLLEVAQYSFITSMKKKNYQIIDGNKQIQTSNYKSIHDIIFKISNDIKIKNLESDILIILKFAILSDNDNNRFVKIYADIFDTTLKSFINSWSPPIENIKIENNCDLICEKVILTENVLDISAKLGKDISNYLNSIFNDKIEKKTYSNKYFIKLLNLNNSDNQKLLDLLMNEFPGYLEQQEIKSENYQVWSYYTPTNPRDVDKWLKSIIKNINTSSENNLKLIINNNKILISN